MIMRGTRESIRHVLFKSATFRQLCPILQVMERGSDGAPRQRTITPRPHNYDLVERVNMATDPWSRPTVSDLRGILESIGKSDVEHGRSVDRLELSVPAEITTSRGNTVSAMTREISRHGIGLLHRGPVSPGEVTVRMASETREFEYRVVVEWCHPCGNGMFLSGGRFLTTNATGQGA